MLQKNASRLLCLLSILVVWMNTYTVAMGQLGSLGFRYESRPAISAVRLDKKARKALRRKLVGTKWKIAKNGLTLILKKRSYSVSDWGKERGIWMVTGHNRIGGVAYEGSHNDVIFEPSLKAGKLIVNGSPFSKITLIQAIKPLAEKLPKVLHESVLGVYGRAIRGKRHAFVNLRPPHRDLWTKAIESKLRGTLSYGEGDYIGTAKLVIAKTALYTVDLPGSGTQLRLNGQTVPSGELKLQKGVYKVEIYTNHWGQPYLKYAHAVVRLKKTKKRIPFVNSQADIKRFLTRKIGGQRVREVSGYEPPKVSYQ